jgi:hypothetical protein
MAEIATPGGTTTPTTDGTLPFANSPLTGSSQTGTGVTGESNTGVGVKGVCAPSGIAVSVTGQVQLPANDGVLGSGSNGVHGTSYNPTGNGVLGENSTDGSGVKGTSASGDGVYGSGGQYGVFGTSTGAFAGVVGQSKTAAPALYGQAGGTGPGILALSGLGALVDLGLGGNLDSSATQLTTQHPGCAGIFVGNAVITGQITTSSLKATNGLSGVNAGTGTSPSVGAGVWGDSDAGYGVYGSSKSGTAGALTAMSR